MMQKLLTGMLVLIFGMFGTIVNAAPIRVQWSGNGNFYEVSSSSLRWTEAKDFAENSTFNGMNGHLVTITAADEDAFVLGLDQLDPDKTYYHTGALQEQGTTDPAANWTWITGESWVYDNWVGQEPNDYQGLAEDNMVLMKGSSGWEDGGWGDIDGDDDQYIWTSNPFIIEYESAPVPEPATILLLGTGLVGIAGIKRRKLKK